MEKKIKKKKPRKKLKVSTMVKRVDKVFSEYIRLRDNYICFTCGKEGNEAGHFISRRYKSVRWDERNVNTQCGYCNRFLSGNMVEYFVRMEEKYGREVIDELMEKKNQFAKFSVSDLLELEEEYKKKLETLK